MVDVIKKLDNTEYKTVIKQDYDVKQGYFYYIELPNELIKRLLWTENQKLNLSVKLGEKGNVIVMTKA